MIEPFVNIKDIAACTAYEFEKICRSCAFNAPLNDHISLCRVLTKNKIYVDTRDTSIAPHLIMDGFWETWLTQCLAHIVKPGDVCLDIGANFGYYSLLMSSLATDKGRTIAIEPNPHIASLLRLTASIQSFSFEVTEVALSNNAGKITLHIPENSFGDASIIQKVDRLQTRTSKVKVKSITLDALLQQMNVEKVDVIKMDVEGVEPLVFEGMQRTLSNNPGIQIITEYSPFLYPDAKGFTEYLFSCFIVYRIKDVDQMTLLDESAIEKLLQITDHTDLYLKRK